MKKLTALIFAVCLSACAMNQSMKSNSQTASGADSEAQVSFAQFNDIPVPEKAVMDLKQSLVFGLQNEWIGRLVFSAPYTQNNMFDFYLSEMPKFGWTELTVVRAKTCVLMFRRGDRVATVQLDADFNGVLVTFSALPESKKKGK